MQQMCCVRVLEPRNAHNLLGSSDEPATDRLDISRRDSSGQQVVLGIETIKRGAHSGSGRGAVPLEERRQQRPLVLLPHRGEKRRSASADNS
jgi:hypothetical protein